ncbi:MAG: AmmeMemoRadiSam system protein B [bacterium]
MPLVFAGISPHPPLLIPSIGKENIKKIEQTQKALGKLEEDLYLTHPDIIVIISPHGSCFSDAFTINMSPEYITDLREFGDLTTRLKFKGELSLAAKIREYGKEQELPIAMVSEEKLDHGSSVPLYFLTAHLPGINILPIGFCNADRKTHLDFGKLINDNIADTNKRVAVIASGDLSHALKTEAPAGYNPAGTEFDAKIQELLSTGNTAGLMQLDEKFVESASECGFRSFLILMGILRDIKYQYKSYSYEGPFGVGYLVANFVI